MKLKFSVLVLLSIGYLNAAAQSTTLNTPTASVGTSTTGNIGIGTTTPADQLEIVSGNRKIGFNSPIPGVTAGGILSLSRPDDGVKILYLGGSASPTDDHVIFGQGGGSEMRLVSAGGTSAGFGFYTNIGFSSAFGSSRPTPVMKIDGSGNVGLGTSTPASILHLNSTVDARKTFRIYWNNDLTKYLSVWQGTGGAALDPIGTGLLYLGYDQSTNVVMGLTAAGLNSGNVGIGVGSASQKLEVAGNLRIDGPTNGYTHSELQFYRGTGVKFASIGQGDLNSANSTFDIQHYNGNDIRFLNMGIEQLRILASNGNVGIGNPNPDAKLAVSGQVHAQEVKVSVTVPGPDYVFEKDYKLTSLEEIKNYIDQNKHLPEVPSAKEMEKNGIQLGEMNMLMLKKIEELTLYVIELKKENIAQNKLNELQQKEIEILKNKIK